MTDPDHAAAAAAFSAHLDELAAQHGVELDEDDRLELFHQSVEAGFTHQSTEAAFADLVGDDDDSEPLTRAEFAEHQRPKPRRDFEADLEHDVGELERDLGRKLTRGEVEGIHRHAIRQVQRDDMFHVDDALEDFHRERGTNAYRPDSSSRSDRVKYATERLRDANPEPSDPDRTFDLDNREDRRAYIVARVQGQEFEDVAAAHDEMDDE